MMYNQVLNVIAVLGMKDLFESKTKIDYKELVKAKYPAVTFWLTNMEKVSLVRKYQIEFENEYIKAMQESWR